jgi:hypothetical protein
MRNAGTAVALGGLGCLPILLLIAFNVFVGGYCTQYVVEYWGAYITGHAVHIPFVVAAVAGLFLGEFTVPAAILTWLLSFVIACAACAT